MCNCRWSPLALGLALGIIWGVSLFIMGLIAYHTSYGRAFVIAMDTLYLGYEPSILGSFVGGLIGFIDAFISGVLIGGLYNLFNSGACTCCMPETKTKVKVKK